MSSLPDNAFPIVASSTKSSGFALAVLVGLAFFIAAQKRVANNAASTR